MATVALVALCTVFYTYAGYPLLVALLARLFPLKAADDAGFLPRVTACVAAHEAAPWLDAKLSSLLALDYPRDRLEILVYSDGSADGTADIAREVAARDGRVRLLEGRVRRGKPAAINAMLEVATGEVLLMTDVRQPLAPGALRALVRRLADPAVACVSGNLVLRGSAGAGAYWRYESWIRRCEARFRGLVGVSGAVYAIRRADMARLPAAVILDDLWVPMRLRLAGRRIAFAEGAMAFDDAFADGREYGRKVRTLAGNYQLCALLPGLLSPLRNPSWFETVSHKLLRLACPWALALLLVTSAAAALHEPAPGAPASLAAWLPRALLAGQAALYLLAGVGPRGGRLGALARTFLVMNTAAVVGLYRFARGAQKATW